MSGLVRNLLTFLMALLAPRADSPLSTTVSHFRVMPWDVGVRMLKSDRYLLLAEASQIDYIVKSGLWRRQMREGLSFVNAAQMVRFSRPIGLFQPVRVETTIVFADQRFAYFSHALFVGEVRHGEVLVKMKFKRGAITVPLVNLVEHAFGEKPGQLALWDQALDTL
jgi:acyl-CoA thioesterase FadM